MKKPHPAKDYFTFSRKDRLAAGAFLLASAALLVLPQLLPDRGPVLRPLPDSLLAAPAPAARPPETEAGAPWEAYAPAGDRRVPERPAALFPFDPNELDAAGWVRLGLPERVARTIVKYRERGGRFRRPEDLQKIWSLPPGFFERVRPMIRMAETTPRFAGGHYPNATPASPPRYAPAPVSINDADSASFENLPGIGAKLASRILRFRERLGGFYRVEQVAETWGLPDSTYQRIRPYLTLNANKNSIRKFNLNTVTKEELKVHPYLRWSLANAVVEYRNRHGNFHSVEELKKLLLVPDSVFERVAPYLIVE